MYLLFMLKDEALQHAHQKVKKLRRATTLNLGKDMEQPELSHGVDGLVRWYNHFGKISGSQSKHILTT